MRPQPSNEQKAQIYNYLLTRYQRIQEEIRLIKADKFELNEQDERKIKVLEAEMKKIYNDSQKLY
jgi:hypothetical protein